MNFTVTEAGRLDSFLVEQDTGLSRSKIQAAIKEGFVSVNEKVITKPAHTLASHDTVSLDSLELTNKRMNEPSIKPVNQHLKVLYEDEACMVINKPAGIAVHPGNAMDPSEETLLSGIAHLFSERGIPFSEDSVLVHRLDKPTTGCILVAKGSNSFGALQKQFENRTTTKKYYALVAGVPEHAKATIDAPIGRNLTDRTKMSIVKTSVSREAKTDYEVLDAADDCALLECTLHTGRTHQIRVHLSSIGHPILGDETYGSPASQKLTEHYDISGLCLHAHLFGFTSPADNKEHFIKAPLSATFSQALAEVSLQIPSG